MYEEIAKIFYDYSINNKRIDDEFLNQICIIFNKYYNIPLKGVVSFENMKKIYDFGKIKGYCGKSTSDYIIVNLDRNRNILINNLYILLTILHEFRHVLDVNSSLDINKNFINIINKIYSKFTDMCLDEDGNIITISLYDNLNEYIKKSLMLNNRENDKDRESNNEKIIDLYLANRFKLISTSPSLTLFDKIIYNDSILVPIERLAYISSHEMMGDVICNLDSFPKFSELIKNLWTLKNGSQYIDIIIQDYNISHDKEFYLSPSFLYFNTFISKFNFDFIKDDVEKLMDLFNSPDNGYTLHDRLLYGLPITKEEYKSINKFNPLYKPYVKKM